MKAPLIGALAVALLAQPATAQVRAIAGSPGPAGAYAARFAPHEVAGSGTRADSFPHAPHRKLFASCTTCHAGIVSGDSSATRPAAGSCAVCHDGTLEERVAWSPAPLRPTNLRFDHREHVREVAGRGDSALACVACHAMPRAAAFMEVERARPASCLSCHAHRAPEHLAATAECASCHRPLPAATRLAAADIARFSKPPSHDSGYVFRHGPDAASASCAFCHTRESCAACHVNASRVATISALGTDARVATLVAAAGPVRYPEPTSHRAADFMLAHGAQAAAGGATCASCHARESCLGCHDTGERIAAIAALPRRAAGVAPGVELAEARPPDHIAGFDRRHRTAAAAGDASCASCHAPSFCSACHDAAASPKFHPRNFVERHGVESFGNSADCASCHQPEAFCVTCHVRTGRARTSAPAGRYHDAQPNWTFGHGGVARRSIETCASCHRQSDCLQCHSSSQGWGVNPHGPGFKPGIADKNMAMCTRCHISGPPRQ